MCNSRKGQASKGKRTAGGEICDTSYDGGKESAAVQLEGEVSPGDLIWIKLHENLWWPAVVVAENGVYGSSKPGNRSEGEVLVRLYGSYDYLYADPVKYNSEFQMILEQNNGSCHEILEKALEQDCALRKSNEPKQQGSESIANSRADAPKGKKKSNQSEVNENEVGDSSPVDVNNGEALSERVGETFSKVSKQKGVKRKLGSNERSSGEIVDSKISEKDRLVKKLKPDSPRAEENARRRNPRRNGSNVGDKSRSRTFEQDGVQKKLKQKSSSTDKQAKNKDKKCESVQEKQRKNNQIVEEGKQHQNSKKNGKKECKPTKKRAQEAAIVKTGTQRAHKQKSTIKGKQVKNKTHKQDGEQKKLTDNKQSAKDDEVKCKSPKQGSVQGKLKSNSQSSEGTSPVKSSESSARRKRVLQGLGLIAPPGSPFHNNGLI